MKTNFLKLGLALVTILAFSFGNAQSTTDVAKATTAVKVVDNKGTIRYFQSNNGITQIVNTTNDITTTTWQLGGTLTDNTYITADGNVFALDGLALETGTASTDAVSLDNGQGGGAGTGWTLLVRDEASGATRKLLASDLVDSGSTSFTATANTLTGTFPITVTGMPAAPSVVWVYRNGAKLVASEYDATVADGVTVTVNPGTTPASWVSYTDDVYEVYWVK